MQINHYNLTLKYDLMHSKPGSRGVKYLKSTKQTYISTNNVTYFVVAVNILTRFDETSLAINK